MTATVHISSDSDPKVSCLIADLLSGVVFLLIVWVAKQQGLEAPPWSLALLPASIVMACSLVAELLSENRWGSLKKSAVIALGATLFGAFFMLGIPNLAAYLSCAVDGYCG